jgi:hypothetical protein
VVCRRLLSKAPNELRVVKVADYWAASRCGARGRGVSAAVVPMEVLLARFRYGLGPRLYSLYRLWRKPTTDWADYIDDHRNKPWLQAINTAEPRRVVDDKVAFQFHCLEHDIPTVPIIGRIGRARNALDALLLEVTGPGPLESMLAEHPDGLFMKPPGGSHGEGAFSVVPEGTMVRYVDTVSPVAKLYEFCREQVRSTGSLLVQPRVRSARDLLPVMSPHGLGTVRAVTHLKGGRAHLLAACLRIPVGRNDADNFRHGEAGNLVAGVDARSGKLLGAHGSRRQDWPDIVDVERHPDTGELIEGFQLPFWPEVIDLVSRAQLDLPQLRTIGWDVAITEQGPLLIEGNGAYDTDILQLAHDCGLKSRLRAALEQP